MKILVTGAKGFVGRNLVENLKNIRDGKNRTRPNLSVSEIFEYDLGVGEDKLDEFCGCADFVFHLAGVNRPSDPTEFMKGNSGFTDSLLQRLIDKKNTCPVMISSSVQASLVGRFANSEYGKSKLAGEEAVFSYAKETGAKVLVYRFPNLFGKWCRPNYNSAVATFCNAIANDLEYAVNDRSTELELLYIDDLINEMFDALEGHEHRCRYEGLSVIEEVEGKYCFAPTVHRATLGYIVDLLQQFKEQPETLMFSSIPPKSFEKKLYSTYLSYLPKERIMFKLKSSADERGSFTEFFKTVSHGQFSVNVSKPGYTKGQHWHNTKMEIFLVVAGRGLIRQRKIGTDENGNPFPVLEFEVSGDDLSCVYMLPGYTHSIVNLSDTEDMVTVMWANEIFDSSCPETYREDV
ncbi:MAG: NAD-dependent epimerase/dehydratase family protein [Lachnospiraceae bacterium]|nr:NAD-dependent epimerase/dehydratase family protein [Lachnospiraceae bacterium]